MIPSPPYAPPALDLERLPDIVFVTADGSERRLTAEAARPAIARAVAALQARCPPGAAVGLMLRSEPRLVIDWLACLAAGFRPLILQYPNRKQNRAYWRDSVLDTIGLTGMHAVVLDPTEVDAQAIVGATVVPQQELDGTAPRPGPLAIGDFQILQLSSGTTGWRKAVAFEGADLARHVADFNCTLGLGRDDVIVSWLPLYHDMGFIACFVAPLMLGLPIVMIDPIDWVGRPGLLFEAIERHGGTTCYMPNFGFEVMARQSPPPMARMRRWISCSEPVSAQTARRFLRHVGAGESAFHPCYAMAENIFAVSFGRGLKSARIDEADAVSCGPPIPGVDVRIVEEQIWVRSPTSLRAYLGGDDIRDADGFYPTGDLGRLIDGELYVAGRRHDVMIQAGRKHLLSDLDLKLNEILPEARGRAACLAIPDARLGTEQACAVIEARGFWARADAPDIARALEAASGVEQAAAAFAPPRFLTKTTSGKFNRRKSAHDWRLAQEAQAQGPRAGAGSPLADLRATFAAADWERPVREALDSLSLTVLGMIAADGAAALGPDDTLSTIAARLASRETAATGAPTPDDSGVIRIVSIAERLLFDRLTPEHLDELGRRLGAPVVFEHVCLPPTAIILSDLIFHDWFEPRLDRAPFQAVDRAMGKLKAASVLLVDDAAEMFYPPEQVYGVLSHNMERDPRADLISVRWQAYSALHDRLPLTVARGGDISLTASTGSIAALSAYLQTPVFRIANFRGFEPFTQGWDWRPMRGFNTAFEPQAFFEAFADWAARRAQPLALRPRSGAASLDLSDAIHFCSHAIRKEAVDLLIETFDRPVAAGRSSSVPYIREQYARRGYSVPYLPSYAPEAIAAAGGDFDGILICGAMGDYPIALPAVALQHVALPWRTRNLERFGERLAHLAVHGAMEDAPESGQDWYLPGELQWGRERDAWLAVRMAHARGEPA